MSYYHHLIKSAVVPAYGALTTAWIAATSETDTTIISALNTLETDLTTYGLTAKIKALYPMVGGTAAKHKFNFMDARDLDAAFRLTFNGGWTHASTGSTPNGVNAFAETYLQPSVSLSQNSTHISYYSRTNRSLDYGVPIGSYDNINNGQLFVSARRSGNNMVARINTPTFIGDTYTGITDSKGFYIGNRTISSYSKLFRNGTSLGNGSVVSSALTTRNLNIGALNTPFGASTYDDEELAIASIGDGLSDTEAANFYTAVQAFQTTLLRNI
jgi:hypothetical protein